MSTSEAAQRAAFISGPLDVTKDYFKRYYKPQIDIAIASGHSFVIGTVSGIDALAFEYLLSQNVPASRIRIYMAGFEIASRPAFVRQIRTEVDPNVIVEAETDDGGDCMSTWDRDAAMTRASGYDILRFRTEAEAKAGYGERWRPRVSNTERNWRRRKGELGMDEREVQYLRHLVKGSKSKRADDGIEECDGSCDGHRDVVKSSFFATKEAFGFGNDGLRTC